jgi:endonuclease/exonuclease/phosphatase family metal-dependent hydrolase
MTVRFASFNIYGMGGRDVLNAVNFAKQHVAPGDAQSSAMGFQEVWTGEQRTRLLDGYVGAAAAARNRANVQIWRDGTARWRCVTPKTRPAGGLELSSGLALCVSGAVRDAFFVRYRGGAIPDSFAQKGVLAVLFEAAGQPRRAVINTHMHDYSNDRFGQHRYAWLDTLVSCVKWIDRNWSVPTVILGDFNINSMTAYTRTSEPDFRCYARLIRVGLTGTATWYDVNARVNQGQPVKTNATRSIDHHLVKGETMTGATFQSLETPASDHRLTISQWG